MLFIRKSICCFLDPPEVNILDAVYVSKLGEHVEMNYTHNNGTYEWLKENLPLSNDPTKYSDLYNNGTDFFTFVIHNIDSNDRGIYTINLKNAAGHANDTTVVKVVRKYIGVATQIDWYSRIMFSTGCTDILITAYHTNDNY